MSALRRVIAAVVALNACAASAQPSDTTRDAERRADVANIEPAVNVGGVSTTGRSEAAGTARAAGSPPSAGRARIEGQAPAVPGPRAASVESAATAQARDTVDLGTTSITGNQELPKVLYIVPWKRSELGDLIGRPTNTLLDEVLAPVDPEEFERHLRYHQTLYGDSSSGVDATGRNGRGVN